MTQTYQNLWNSGNVAPGFPFAIPGAAVPVGPGGPSGPRPSDSLALRRVAALIRDYRREGRRLFGAVTAGSTPDAGSIGADDLPLANLNQTGFSVQDAETYKRKVRTVMYNIEIIAGDTDRMNRYMKIDQLSAAVVNAAFGPGADRTYGGLCLPDRSIVTGGNFERTVASDQQLTINCQCAYMFDPMFGMDESMDDGG